MTRTCTRCRIGLAVALTLSGVILVRAVWHTTQPTPQAASAQQVDDRAHAFLPLLFRRIDVVDLPPYATALPSATPTPTMTPTPTATATATVTPSPTITPTDLPPLEPGDLPHPDPAGFRLLGTRDVAALGLVPFDVERQDTVGPDSHAAIYGKLPEIVVDPGENHLDVALRSFDEPDQARTLILRFEDEGGGLALTRAIEAPTLGLLLGFVSAPDGGFYYATGSPDPDVSATYPAAGQRRRNVVLVYRVGADGHVAWVVDLDPARAQVDAKAEQVIRPGTASTARLALAGNQLALVHGINTVPDPSIQNRRHQKALTNVLDATTGELTDIAGIWCSHSFDQRYLVDGDDIYEAHLGDAYPRQVPVARIRDGVSGRGLALFYPKGQSGDNNTFTRLGALARIDAGPAEGRFLLLIATERTTGTAKRVSGSRDLALVRTTADFAADPKADPLDPSFGTTFTVASGGSSKTNRVQWLTSYHLDAPDVDHAERPKLVALGDGEFMVLWEHWSIEGERGAFEGTYAMVIDGDGTVLALPERVADGHLPRGDDAFAYDGAACWVTGDSRAGSLILHCVSPQLVAREVVLGPTTAAMLLPAVPTERGFAPDARHSIGR